MKAIFYRPSRVCISQFAAVVAVLVLSFAGCSKSGSSTDSTATPAATGSSYELPASSDDASAKAGDNPLNRDQNNRPLNPEKFPPK
jgi:hypothetical protein